MTERPIIFSSASVRAILAGRKTQTRRIVKAPGLSLEPRSHDYAVAAEMVTENGVRGAVFWGDRGASVVVPCPFGLVGDQLWVRETHYVERAGHPDGRDRFILYRATDDHAPVDAWTTPIYMPRWASRLTLEVTAVRVERLQAITEEDARAEGVDAYVPGHGPVTPDELRAEPGYAHARMYRDGYEHGWNEMHGWNPPAWAVNPWVWIVEFKKVEASR